MNFNADSAVVAHELIHLLITALIAFFIWLRFKNLKSVLAVFLLGLFIDLDHWFDYLAYYGWKINFKDFFNVSSYVHGSGRVYVLFHGWEFVLPFWLIGRYFGKKFKIKGLEWAMAISYLGHLCWDNFSFSHHPLAYSFVFRLLNNFSLRSFNRF